MAYFVSTALFLTTFCCSVFASENKIPLLYLHSDNESDYRKLQAGQKFSTTTGTNLLAIAQLDSEIIFEFMPLSRSRAFMNRHQPICVIDKLKTQERESQYLFTLPVNIFINRRLYQLAEATPLDQDEVFLPEVFATDSQRKLLLTSQISYGSVITAQLLQIPEENKIYRNAAAHEKGLMAMFSKKRADYALFFPQQLTDPSALPQTRSYKIKEAKPYVLGHIMCANIAGMSHVIAQLNNNLKEAFRNGELYQQHAKYLSPDLLADFDLYYNEVAEQYFY